MREWWPELATWKRLVVRTDNQIHLFDQPSRVVNFVRLADDASFSIPRNNLSFRPIDRRSWDRFNFKAPYSFVSLLIEHPLRGVCGDNVQDHRADERRCPAGNGAVKILSPQVNVIATGQTDKRWRLRVHRFVIRPSCDFLRPRRFERSVCELYSWFCANVFFRKPFARCFIYFLDKRSAFLV